MSKERELLKRTIYFLEPLDWEANVEQECQYLITEIEELLAQPELRQDSHCYWCDGEYDAGARLAQLEQKPVRKVVIGDSFMIDDTKYIKAREPLSDERKLAIIQECKDANGIRSKSFIGLCDAIEKAHGIGCDEWYWRYSDE